MLEELKVSQFAVIDNLHILFRDGLNILSGETGAGKSVLLKSLALLMGDKSSTQMVRSGSEQASVEGLFDIRDRKDIRSSLEKLGIPVEDDHLLVRRILRSDDRSRVYINGTLSSLSDLRSIVSPLVELTGQVPLIEMTGQHENKNLLSKAYHLDVLDHFALNSSLRAQYEKSYRSYSEVTRQILSIREKLQGSASRLDYLNYQKSEIARLNLVPGEEVELENEYKRLKGFHKMSAFLEVADSAIESSEDSLLGRMNSLLRRAQEFTHQISEIDQFSQALDQSRNILSEALFTLHKGLGGMDLSAERLEEIESRLSDLRKVQKKFGSSTDEILESLFEIEREILGLENLEDEAAELSKRALSLEQELKALAKTLHEKRFEASRKLSQQVNRELKDLNMQGVTCSLSIIPLEGLGPTGSDEAQFYIQSSIKDQPRPLSKIASGGELSRILLAIKKVSGKGEQPRTYLFDEVDAGVSGETAHKVGAKLKEIAKGQQVICVTHLPQVAAYADAHFRIQKVKRAQIPQTEVQELSAEDRIQEIARLLSGDKVTPASLKNAQELLNQHP